MISIFQREPDGFSSAVKSWTGQTVVLIGGGPSLTIEDVFAVGSMRRADLVRVIAINDAYLIAPWADVLYAADANWWRWHSEGIAKPVLGMTAAQVRDAFIDFKGERCTIECSGARYAGDASVHSMRNRDHPNNGMGLSLDPSMLVTGHNSGFQALNLAILAGAARVLLLGFDGRPASSGKTHWSGGHPRPTVATAYEQYRRAFSAAEADIQKAGVQVINCSPDSYIDSFAKMPLRQAL